MSSSSTAILLTSITQSINLFGVDVYDWQIYAAGTSSPVIAPDVMVSIELRGDAEASDYPVQAGGFGSYNKVMKPTQLRVVMACANEQMSRSDFLAQLEQMKQSTNLYDISTPDALYEDMTMTHYDYKRSATQGASLLKVEAWFEEIRQTASASYTNSSMGQVGVASNSPGASDPQNSGTVTTYAYGANPATVLTGVL